VDKLVSLARLHCHPLAVGVNVDNYSDALYAFAHDHCAIGRTFALRGVGLLLRRLLGLFVPRACCSLARRACFDDFSSDVVLSELQKFMLSGVQGAETTLTTHEVDGELRLHVPPEHTKRHSYKALAKLDMRRFWRMLAALLPVLKLPFAADAERPRIRALLNREGSSDILDKSFAGVRHSTLLLLLRRLQLVLQEEDFLVELRTARELASVHAVRASKMLVPRITPGAAITLTPTAMTCVHKTMSPLDFAAEVAALRAAALHGTTGTIVLTMFSVVVLYNRAERRAQRLEAAAAAPPAAAAAAPPPPTRRVGVRFAARRRHGAARFVDVDGGFVAYEAHELIGDEAVEKVKMSTKDFAKAVRSAHGVNTTGKVVKLTATRGAGRAKKDLKRATLAETAQVVRQRTGIAELDVGGADLGKGNTFAKVVRTETVNGLVRDVVFTYDLSKGRCKKMGDTVYEHNVAPAAAAAAPPDAAVAPAPADVAAAAPPPPPPAPPPAPAPTDDDEDSHAKLRKRGRRNAIHEGIARAFKKMRPLVFFVNADYLHGFAPVLRQLLRLGAFVVLVDEFRTSEYCAGCSGQLQRCRADVDRMVCRECAEADAGRKGSRRFSKDAMASARRAPPRAAEHAAVHAAEHEHADAESVDDAGGAVPRTRAQVVDAVRTEFNGLAAPRRADIVRLLCQLRGSEPDEGVRVLSGLSGAGVVHALATQVPCVPAHASPELEIDVVGATFAYQRYLLLRDLSTANLRRRLLRELARARCAECAPGADAPKCGACAWKRLKNRLPRCAVCRRDADDGCCVVKESVGVWRYKACGKCPKGRVHRDANAVDNLFLIVFNLFDDVVRGGRPYPLWCCTVEAADRLDGVVFAWNPAWNKLQKDGNGGGAGVGDSRKRAAPTTSAPSAWPTRAPAPSSTGKQTSLLTWFARPTKARDESPSDAGALAAETAPGGADQLDDERALGVGDPLPHDAVDAEMDASVANYVDPDADIDDKVAVGGLLAAAAAAANAPAAGNQHADACIASAVEAGEHAFEVDGQLDDEIDDAAMYECEYDEDAELEQAINESALEYLADTINTTTTTTADNDSETDAGHRDKRRRADSPGTTTTTSTATNININASHNQNNPITENHTAASGPAVAVTETDGLIAKVTVFTSRTATGWRISTTTEISCTATGTRTIINNVYSSNTSNTSNADSQNIVYNSSNDSNSDSLPVLVGNQPTEQRATTSATSSSAPK
jgi:hypothetical protein